MFEYSGVQKSMRKGTRSCLPCRKRKIRCSGAGGEGQTCTECKARGSECVAQGVARDADHDAVNQRLQERVALLEASLKELKQSSTVDATPFTTHGDGHFTKQRNGADGSRSAAATARTANSHGLEFEQAVDSTVAPLACLMSNPRLGAQPGELLGAVDDHTPYNQSARQSASKHREVVNDLCSHLPSETEILDICENHSSWWRLYRDCLGCVWGDGDLPTLRSFATQVLQEKKPPMLGLLFVCFAISTGELQRYLPPVERQILNDDEYAGSEGGLNCLMALGLCYMASLQPRRAWMVHRRANGLIQLNGIHIRRRTAKHDILFWELFHADRWVSLMIGLPYMMPDHLCDVTIPPLGEIDEHTWLYRKLGLVTGRVIDCLQAVKGATLSATLQVEEEMEKIRMQLSPGYLDIESIRVCADPMEKYIRLYRVVHFYQLRAFVHLPFLLRSATQERYEFSGKSCTDDSRKLLEAYLELYDSNPLMVTNATVMNFNVFICTGILLLSLIGYGRSKTSEHVLSQAQLYDDWHTFHKVMHVLEQVSQDKSVGLLCKTCHTALESLLESARGAPGDSAPKKVVLPYFGTLSITRHDPGPAAEPVNAGESGHSWRDVEAVSSGQQNGSASGEYVDLPFDMNLGLGMDFAYDGPFLPEGNVADWMGLQQDGTNFDLYGGQEADWSWLGADLPPNFGL